jgi:hypothetical protein
MAWPFLLAASVERNRSDRQLPTVLLLLKPQRVRRRVCSMALSFYAPHSRRSGTCLTRVACRPATKPTVISSDQQNQQR